MWSGAVAAEEEVTGSLTHKLHLRMDIALLPVQPGGE